jgi:hypothetical protein
MWKATNEAGSSWTTDGRADLEVIILLCRALKSSRPALQMTASPSITQPAEGVGKERGKVCGEAAYQGDSPIRKDISDQQATTGELSDAWRRRGSSRMLTVPLA